MMKDCMKAYFMNMRNQMAQAVLQQFIKNKPRIDVRARPVTSYQHCLPLLLSVNSNPAFRLLYEINKSIN